MNTVTIKHNTHYRIALLCLLVSVFVSGCSTTPIALDYVPASTLKVAGSLSVGHFRYLPVETHTDLQANQVRNTAIGAIVLDQDVNRYFETALTNEAAFVGITIDRASPVVSGEIMEFLIDDLGFSVDWTFNVHYTVSKNNASKGNQPPCYEKTVDIKKTASKYSQPFTAFNEVIKLNIEKLFADTLFVSCIAQ